MTEPDPMVQAFLKARTKNIREEVQLKRYLANLELRKINTKAYLDNEIFEHRRVVFDLRKEADLNKKQLGVLPLSCTEPPDSVFGGKSENRKPSSRLDSRVTFVEKDNNTEEIQKGTMVTILSKREDESIEPFKLHKDADIFESDTKPRLSSVISFPPVWKISSAKQRYTICDDDVFPVDVFDNSGKDDILRNSKGLSQTEVIRCWMGDPMAISSVRRPRRSPKELNSKEQSRVGFRTAARELRQFASCSKNCGKSQFIYEMERSIADNPLLLPAIQAERERKAQEENRLKRERIGSTKSQQPIGVDGLPSLPVDQSTSHSKRPLIRSDTRVDLTKSSQRQLSFVSIA